MFSVFGIWFDILFDGIRWLRYHNSNKQIMSKLLISVSHVSNQSWNVTISLSQYIELVRLFNPILKY